MKPGAALESPPPGARAARARAGACLTIRVVARGRQTGIVGQAQGSGVPPVTFRISAVTYPASAEAR